MLYFKRAKLNTGGAIYTDREPSDLCFFQVVDAPPAPSSTVQVSFMNNTAHYAGSDMYGYVERCCESLSACNNFYNIFKTSNTENDPSAVASDTQKSVCVTMRHFSRTALIQTKFTTLMLFRARSSPSDWLLMVAGLMGVIRAYSFYNATPGYLQSSQVVTVTTSTTPSTLQRKQ